ncbi:Orexin receptor type 2 [Desmophyllum pertusum]|uniref:Orexin receptor type 2 n=1 Tax=Desmophyllum pertusum TaxID=174260 RepID=A0A9W9ZRA4_9CNID|nr:Orexin receptor type 2 [Desmophyllum pertusum]
MLHGFSSCGILESQYQGFAEAAKIGNVGDKYIDYVYGTMGYMQTVLKAGDDCMTEQIYEVQNTDSYQQRNGVPMHTIQQWQCCVMRLTVIEVAHDFVLKIKNWLWTLNIQNSFDTWHEASVKCHFYYSMKNCTSPDNLRRRLLTILDHYQGNHTNCDPDSKCKNPGYRCSKVKLNNPRAIAALHKFILDSKVYKLAEDYYLCCDTYWVESFNNVILIYCPKRIHFSDRTFNIRIALAVMDWNENVNREATTISLIQDVHRPTRRTGHKNLYQKLSSSGS